MYGIAADPALSFKNDTASRTYGPRGLIINNGKHFLLLSGLETGGNGGVGRQTWISDLVTAGSPVEKKQTPIQMAHSAVVEINGKVYIAGSSNLTSKAHCYEYDYIYDNWVRKADMPEGVYSAAYAKINNKFHVFGGHSTNDNTNSLKHQIYDPVTDTWEVKATPLPIAISRIDAVEGPDNKFYFIGGYKTDSNQPAPRDFYIYDPALDLWSKGPDHPIGVYYPVVGRIRNKLYAMGGNINDFMVSSGTKVTDVVYEFDFDTRVWSLTKTRMGILVSESRVINLKDNILFAYAGMINPSGASWASYYIHAPGIIIREISGATVKVSDEIDTTENLNSGNITAGSTSAYRAFRLVNATGLNVENIVIEAPANTDPKRKYEVSYTAGFTAGAIYSGSTRTIAGPIVNTATIDTIYTRLVTTRDATIGLLDLPDIKISAKVINV